MTHGIPKIYVALYEWMDKSVFVMSLPFLHFLAFNCCLPLIRGLAYSNKDIDIQL